MFIYTIAFGGGFEFVARPPRGNAYCYWTRAHMLVKLPALPEPYGWCPDVHWKLFESIRWNDDISMDRGMSSVENQRLHAFVSHRVEPFDGVRMWLILRRRLAYPAARVVFMKLLSDDLLHSFTALNLKQRRRISAQPLYVEIPLTFSPALSTRHAQTRSHYLFTFCVSDLKELVEPCATMSTKLPILFFHFGMRLEWQSALSRRTDCSIDLVSIIVAGLRRVPLLADGTVRCIGAVLVETPDEQPYIFDHAGTPLRACAAGPTGWWIVAAAQHVRFGSGARVWHNARAASIS